MKRQEYITSSIEFGLRIHKVTARVGKTALASMVGPDVNRNTIQTITRGEGYTLVHLPNNILERVLNACRSWITDIEYTHMQGLIEKMRAYRAEETVLDGIRIPNPLSWIVRKEQSN